MVLGGFFHFSYTLKQILLSESILFVSFKKIRI